MVSEFAREFEADVESSGINNNNNTSNSNSMTMSNSVKGSNNNPANLVQ